MATRSCLLGCTLAALLTLLFGADVADAKQKNADQLLPVHCLLPGQLRQLGARTTYLSPRRPVRTSARDCEKRGGEYVRVDQAPLDALALWLPLAESGNSDAQRQLGELLERVTPPKAAEAANWYEAAANQGDRAAMLHLARLLENGSIGEPDPDAAAAWVRRAVDKVPGINGPGTSAPQTSAAKKPPELAPAEPEPVAAVPNPTPPPQVTPKPEPAFISIAWQPSSSATEARLTAQVSQLSEALRAAQSQRAALAATTTEQSSELLAATQQQAALEQQLQQARTRLSATERQKAERNLAGPTLSLIEPSLPVTRGLRKVRLPVSKEVVYLAGRVDAPAGLMSLRINGTAVNANEAGVFQHEINITPDLAEAHLVAIDQQGKRDDLRLAVARPTPIAPAALPDDVDPRLGLDFGRYHALIIGNNRYPKLPTLETAVNDAEELAKTLKERYGFRTTLLKNANRYQILSALNRLRETLNENDNLLIYYAGHGELDPLNDRGHWLPVDAEPESSANWISNVAITDIVNAMNARHVLLLVDSCYAGTLTRSAITNLRGGLTDAQAVAWTQQLIQKKARLVLTSGGIAPVLDEGQGGHSVFAGAVLRTLNSNEGLLSSRDLFQSVAAHVSHAASRYAFEQLPEYAPLRFAGHEAGEFFLKPKVAGGL